MLLSHILKMPSFGTNTHMEMFAPLTITNCVINHALLQATPDIECMLLQFVSIINLHLVQMLLHFSPNVVVSRFQIWIVGATGLAK